ncbi:MAG: DUF1549 domain-containing protein [Planctomycetota bacterium]|nr:DUF1549 domain-containing protein [Planctomycetota bacterium]
METRKYLLLPATVVLAVFCLVAWVAARPAVSAHSLANAPRGEDVAVAADRVDALLQATWAASSIEPAKVTDELQVFRRLALALVGTAPSFEEIRQFEADTSPERLQQWTARLVADSRFVEYFAARLGDAFVDPVTEDLKPHQRERFRRWLGNSLQQGKPYSEIAREMIASRGVFADRPATTFVALEISLGDQAAERLAARTSRAFLGQRIDCAQCHDHPFADWTQPQFEGLAAYYGQVQFRSARLQDTRPRSFVIEDNRTQEERTVTPEVPFDTQWVPDNRHLRSELAAWVTHPENRRFRRAIANRVWGLMLGRAFVSPVDDLPDPASPDDPDVLDVLADNLANQGDDLRRLIHVIVATRPFSLASTHEALDDEVAAQQVEEAWAVFPVTELGPQQMIRAMQQAAAVSTLRAEDSNTYTALRRFERQFRFVEEYGIAGDAEDAQASTIPHTVQRLSGSYTRQHSEATLLTAPGRIAAMSSDAATCLENCYLACLSRRPTLDEQAHFLPQLQGNRKQRANAVEDIYWTLFNSAEFCWNH